MRATQPLQVEMSLNVDGMNDDDMMKNIDDGFNNVLNTAPNLIIGKKCKACVADIDLKLMVYSALLANVGSMLLAVRRRITG